MFSLPDLPYDYRALEPHLDSRTLEIHHSGHHAAYVKNLNTLLEPYPNLSNLQLTDLISRPDGLPDDIKIRVKNQAGGVLNHNLFWKFMSPELSAPEGKLLSAITDTFSGLDNFKQQFTSAAVSHFGSGWIWLVADDGRLKITTTANQDSPCSLGQIPLLCLDVWEHAYYLKYQNRRADFITAWWHVVNWTEVSSKYHDCC